MDFADAFQAQFEQSPSYIETDLDLNKKLQDTRNALQESISENDQLALIINQLYDESRVENVALTQMIDEIKAPIFKNVPLPRNADTLPLSEKAGYVVYYLKFLGYATRKTIEEHQTAKEHLESLHSSVKKSTVVDPVVKRTGALRVPELDGHKESKRSVKTTAPMSPPATPPEKTSRPKKN
jgi:hypothetical protein